MRARALALALATLAGLAACAAALARPGGTPAPSALTLAATPGRVLVGGRVILHGAVAPAVAGRLVLIERRRAGGGWAIVQRARTDSLGRYSARIAAGRSGTLRARAGSAGSAPLRLAVFPRATARAEPGAAFAGARLTIRVEPASYTGRATVVVRSGSKQVGRVTGLVRSGRLTLLAPTPGVGRFSAEIALAPGAGFDGRRLTAALRATAQPLQVGWRGPAVIALRARLAALRFHVPGPDLTFGASLFDSVLAFQKARGLPRTGAVDARTWAELGAATPPRARFREPAVHIEIDKSRQILLVVHGGRVAGVLPVSTGATGNTPVGAFRILWKAPATGTWLGNAILYRTMTFHGNFAIHGFAPVPAYPASHGCVRVPIWAADWLYDQSPVGERVYIYT